MRIFVFLFVAETGNLQFPEMKLLNYLLFLVFLAGTTLLHAQIPIKTYTTATDTFYWKHYEHVPKPAKLNLNKFRVSGSAAVIDRFMALYADDYPQFTNDSLEQFTVKDWKKHLFTADVNGDGLADVIFEGPDGGESEIVRIYLNHRERFELIFEDYQYLTRLEKIDGKLSALETGDIGSAGQYLYFTRKYQVNWEEGTPSIIKGKQIVNYKYTELPLKYFPDPTPCSSIGDTLLLRASAARINEPFIPKPESFGNIIARYRSKTKGVMLATKSYGKGNVWFYVEIEPDVYPTASILYGLDKFPVFVRGWVSGSSVSATGK